MSAATVGLRDVLAGIVRVREALSDGDFNYADAVAAQVEDELAGAILQQEAEADSGARELARLRVELEAERGRLRGLTTELEARRAALSPPRLAATRGGQ